MVHVHAVGGGGACRVAFSGKCIFLSVDVGIRQKICSRKLHSSGRLCDGGSGMCI